MNITDGPIVGLKIIDPVVHSDERGFFMESFRQEWLPGQNFVQDNHSKSIRNTLRGMHYQLRNPQGKLIRVTQGVVFDVALDMRANSPQFGKWFSIILSAENKKMLWIPEGFAHGFLVVSELAEFEYKCTNYYAPSDERVVRWNDETLKIPWPCAEENLIISQRDGAADCFVNSEAFRENQ